MTGLRHYSISLDTAYRIFFEALKSDDIDAVISAAWGLFNLPVLLTDENYKLIAQYPQRRIGEEIWDALFAEKSLPVDLIRRFQDEFLDGKDRTYEPFYASGGLVQGCPRIFAEVYEGEKILGHLAVFMFDEPFFENDLAVVRVLLDALKMLMSPRKNRTRMSLSSYLRDLLAKDTPERLSDLARSSLGAIVPGDYCILATPVGNTASQRAFASMSHARPRYSASLPVVITAFGDSIAALVGALQNKEGDYAKSEKEFFEELIKSLSLTDRKSGVSRRFSALTDVAGHFAQALGAAKSAKKQIEYFDSAYPAPLFRLMSEQVDPMLITDPLLLKLVLYDRQNNTEYFQTLQIYCKTFRDRDLCAKLLCVHRNTLLYRLNRARELFGINYEDPAVLGRLYISFELYNAAEK